jgi:hypothetical protein
MVRYENHVFAGRQQAAVVLAGRGPASGMRVNDMLVVRAARGL